MRGTRAIVAALAQRASEFPSVKGLNPLNVMGPVAKARQFDAWRSPGSPASPPLQVQDSAPDLTQSDIAVFTKPRSHRSPAPRLPALNQASSGTGGSEQPDVVSVSPLEPSAFDIERRRPSFAAAGGWPTRPSRPRSRSAVMAPTDVQPSHSTAGMAPRSPRDLPFGALPITPRPHDVALPPLQLPSIPDLRSMDAFISAGPMARSSSYARQPRTTAGRVCGALRWAVLAMIIALVVAVLAYMLWPRLQVILYSVSSASTSAGPMGQVTVYNSLAISEAGTAAVGRSTAGVDATLEVCGIRCESCNDLTVFCCR
jgi:hypothetical protein